MSYRIFASALLIIVLILLALLQGDILRGSGGNSSETQAPSPTLPSDEAALKSLKIN